MVASGGLTDGLASGPVLAGTAASFVTSVFAMKVMILVVVKRRLGWFALYCMAAGVFAIALGVGT